MKILATVIKFFSRICFVLFFFGLLALLYMRMRGEDQFAYFLSNGGLSFLTLSFQQYVLISVILFIICLITNLFSELLGTTKKKTEVITYFVLSPFRVLLLTFFFPAYFLVVTVKSIPFREVQESLRSRVNLYPLLGRLLLKTLYLCFVLFITVPLWISLLHITGMIAAKQLRIIEEPVPISGTGSMYPTFPKGTGKTQGEQAKELVSMPGMLPYPSGFTLFGKTYFGHMIGRGDIVVFENEKTDEITLKTYGEKSGYVKRVIAVGGDSIELRDGLVYVNGTVVKEPYTAKARSTFGGEFLPDCRKTVVPQGHVFVMGDNRKGSGDSRFDLGFVPLRDIDHVLPWENQLGYLDRNFRDTSQDQTEQAKIKVDKLQFLALLNEKRQEAGVKPLRYDHRLEMSASKRANVILKFDDLSFEATRSGYTIKKAVQEVGYENVLFGEAPRQGHYDADELIENFFEFPDSTEFLLNKDYQDFGLAEVSGQINGCPTNVIVQHFGGYVPPTYTPAQVQSYRNAVTNLREIQPGWQRLKTVPRVYDENKSDVDEINTIIETRIQRLSEIAALMEQKKWLTDREQFYIEEDAELNRRQAELAQKLNNL